MKLTAVLIAVLMLSSVTAQYTTSTDTISRDKITTDITISNTDIRGAKALVVENLRALKERILEKTASELNTDDEVVDILLNETEREHPDNFTRRLNQGRLISIIEQVKRDYIKRLIHELNSSGSRSDIKQYITRYNRALNNLKENIRERFRSGDEELSIRIAEELAERELRNITSEVRADVVVNDDRIAELIANKSNGQLIKENVKQRIQNLSPEFKKKLLIQLLADYKEEHKAIVDQIRGINDQYRDKIRDLTDQIRGLNRERVDRIRELLRTRANATALIES
jgi:hypothetical protein